MRVRILKSPENGGGAAREGTADADGTPGRASGGKLLLRAARLPEDDWPVAGDLTPRVQILRADARSLPLPSSSVDLVVTSPPYWRKRDYGLPNQIGQELTPREYVSAMMRALTEWRRVLRPSGSVFLNIGDTYWNRSLAGIPGRIEAAAEDDGWKVRNRIIWAKEGGMPEPAKDRLVNRHEYILHLASRRDYYYD
jgi:SAM-dependent methyltransferase